MITPATRISAKIIAVDMGASLSTASRQARER